MISRAIIERLITRLRDNRILIILGPRQAGKTTVLNMLDEEISETVRWLNGDEPDHRVQLQNATSSALRSIIGNAKYLFIDEAQRIENIGISLKLIAENIEGVKVIATGSSAFDLANKISEPLTGRKWEYYLLPFSHREMADHSGDENERRLLEHRMIYGYYPEVVNNPGDESPVLRELAGSYLYKDILTWERIRKPDKLERLVRALALQIGSEVSYNELGQTCGIDNETAEKYIVLLEKAFIVFRLYSYSRNLRNELKKSRKVYFYDNGLRNAVINQFSPLALRPDTGQLWENFLMSGRLKLLSNLGIDVNRYFWRTHAQQEIDYIEESGRQLKAYEMKWNPNKKPRFPKSFLNAYPGANTQIISSENYESFLTAI